MKHWKSSLVGVAAVAAVALPGMAAASPALAQKNACMACHSVDRKLVGPAFREVAMKYAGQADAQAQLARSIKAGGAGKWGPIPMPTQATLSDADAGTLAAWILAGAQ